MPWNGAILSLYVRNSFIFNHQPYRCSRKSVGSFTLASSLRDYHSSSSICRVIPSRYTCSRSLSPGTNRTNFHPQGFNGGATLYIFQKFRHNDPDHWHATESWMKIKGRVVQRGSISNPNINLCFKESYASPGITFVTVVIVEILQRGPATLWRSIGQRKETIKKLLREQCASIASRILKGTACWRWKENDQIRTQWRRAATTARSW